MKHARPALVIAVGALAVLGLTACQKPNPSASVFSGTSSQWREAACWAAEGSAIDPTGCATEVLEKAGSDSVVGTIPVVPGETIGISVDPVVADTGWVPTINGQALAPAVLNTTYYRFTFPEFQEVPEEGLVMEIVAGSPDQARGVWLFRLIQP